MKKGTLTLLAASFALCMSVPVFAKTTYTSPDGVLSIDLPDEDWKSLQDPQKWIVLSDGANLITVDHYSNGEKLPEITVADDHYVNVYQAAFSTQNEVFLVTGSVVDAAKIPDVANAILTTKILQYDTKQAVKKEDAAQQNASDQKEPEKKETEKKADASASSSEYTVAPMSATMYATSGVNVRSGYSTNDSVIGGLGTGNSVAVTGKVQKNGKDYGWYQVSFEGKNGYVSAEFLSSTAPAGAPASTGLTFTGNAKTIYDSNGNAITVYEASDNDWYASNGKGYSWISDYEFAEKGSGTIYTTNKPQNGSGSQPSGAPFTVYWENGNAETLTPYSDGYYYSSGWVRYWDNGDNTYHGSDGTVLLASLGGPGNNDYVPDYDDDSDDGNETHMLSSVDTGATVTVSAGGGAYYDNNGTEYSWIDDGLMMDFYGNRYYVLW